MQIGGKLKHEEIVLKIKSDKNDGCMYNATKLLFGLQEQDLQSKRRLSKTIQMLCQNDFASIVAQPTSRQGSVLTNQETGMKTL